MLQPSIDQSYLGNRRPPNFAALSLTGHLDYAVCTVASRRGPDSHGQPERFIQTQAARSTAPLSQVHCRKGELYIGLVVKGTAHDIFCVTNLSPLMSPVILG